MLLTSIPLLLSVVGFVNAKLALKAPKYSLLSESGSVIKADALDLANAHSEILTPGATDTLKLSFTVIDDESVNEGVQPHQAFLRFWIEGGVEGIQPVKVSPNGKAKFELNVRRPPPGIPATTRGAVLNVDLILGSFAYASSTVPLFQLRLPASLPVAPHPEEVLYRPRPAIYHTFKGEQRTPPETVSFIFVIIALSPWILLFSLLWKLPIHIAPSSATAPFIVLLAAYEGLIVWYWIDLRIGQVLTYGAILAVFTAAAGKRALASL